MAERILEHGGTTMTATTTLSALEIALLNQVLTQASLAEPAWRNLDGVELTGVQVRASEWHGQPPRWSEPHYIEVAYRVEGGGPHFGFIPLRGVRVGEWGSVRLDVPAEAVDPSGTGIEVTTTAGHQLRAPLEVFRGWVLTIKAPRNP
jgi:hypothetical protein